MRVLFICLSGLIALLLMAGLWKLEAQRDKEDALAREVTRILIYEWNPTDEPKTALDTLSRSGYEPQVSALLLQGCNEGTMARLLDGLMVNNMKWNSDPEKCLRAAKLLIQARDEWRLHYP